MTDQPSTDAELEAVLALAAARPDAAAMIAALLRSGELIGPLLRNALADALTGGAFDGPWFRLEPGKRGAAVAKHKVAVQQWMTVGAWMEDQIAAGMPRTGDHGAVKAAAAKFRIGEKKADAALDYYREAVRWAERQRQRAAEIGVEWPPGYLLAQFHFLRIRDQRRGNEQRRKRVDEYLAKRRVRCASLPQSQRSPAGAGEQAA